jgi:L-lysine exporter family protein LysE/ArgO
VGIAVFICALSDAVLIIVGTAGMGALVQSHKSLLKAVSWIGAAYLFYFSISAARRVFKSESLEAGEVKPMTKKAVVLSVLGFTWLNPHVYLDTVLLVGSIGSQFGNQRWLFAVGAALASLIWFVGLGYGSKAAARVMAKPITWRILDIFIAVVMASIAISLINTALKN